MDELRTTPHDFIWRVKNPQDYWADTLKEVKYDVYLNGKRRGGFIGVNRTFDDDMYYVNYYDENNNIAYCTAYTDTEIILKRVNRKEGINVMYTRLNNTITNAIKDVMSNSVCDFDNWWKDDFETEVYFETAEDFKNLSDTDLEIAKYDWISWCLDGFVSEVCNLLGIKMYNTHSKYNEIILKEIHDIVKNTLFDRIGTMK